MQSSREACDVRACDGTQVSKKPIEHRKILGRDVCESIGLVESFQSRFPSCKGGLRLGFGSCLVRAEEVR
jgi:hypothetical protein